MALKRKEKEALVQELKEKFSRCVSVIMTDFTGVNVSDSNALRQKLRESGADYKVFKNTLLKRAAEGTSVEVLSDRFVGPNAVAIAYDDPVTVAKVLVEFAKKNEALEIKGGMLDGKYMDAEGIKALSKLPSREVLLAQLLSVMVAPATNMVQVLAAVPRKMLYVLKAIQEDKG